MVSNLHETRTRPQIRILSSADYNLLPTRTYPSPTSRRRIFANFSPEQRPAKSDALGCKQPLPRQLPCTTLRRWDGGPCTTLRRWDGGRLPCTTLRRWDGGPCTTLRRWDGGRFPDSSFWITALLPPRAPSSPPGPAPELFEDTRLRLSMEHLPALRGHSPTPLHGTPLLPAPRWHYRGTLAAAFQRPTLGTGTPVSTPPGFGPPVTTPAPTQPLAATPSLMTSSARPSGPDRPFRLLRDSDRPLRHRPPRSRSPQRSPDPPGHSIAAASSGSAHPPDYSDRLDTLNRGTTHPPTTTGFFAAPRLHLIRPGSTLDGLPRSPPDISGAPGC